MNRFVKRLQELTYKHHQEKVEHLDWGTLENMLQDAARKGEYELGLSYLAPDSILPDCSIERMEEALEEIVDQRYNGDLTLEVIPGHETVVFSWAPRNDQE